MLTVDSSHQNCERMNFDLCKSFVTSVASEKPYWGQMVGLVRRSHSERHRKRKSRGPSRIHCAHGREESQEAMEVEGRQWTVRAEGLVGTLQGPTLMTHPRFPGPMVGTKQMLIG